MQRIFQRDFRLPMTFNYQKYLRLKLQGTLSHSLHTSMTTWFVSTRAVLPFSTGIDCHRFSIHDRTRRAVKTAPPSSRFIVLSLATTYVIVGYGKDWMYPADPCPEPVQTPHA